jgi:hypothetical protein
LLWAGIFARLVGLALVRDRDIFGKALARFNALDWRMDMVPDRISSRDALWRSIRHEAETALANDPIFGSSLSTSVFVHSSLGAAVSHQIGQRLGKNIGEQHQFTRVANEAFAASPELTDAASRDLEGIVLHDPASTALLPALLNFKGYVALQAWQLALASEPARPGSSVAKRVIRFASGQHPSVGVDRDVGVPGSRHRHRSRRLRHHRQ